jgi:hypothetical protein
MKSVELGMPGGKNGNNKDVRTVSGLNITASERPAGLLAGGVIR